MKSSGAPSLRPRLRAASTLLFCLLPFVFCLTARAADDKVTYQDHILPLFRNSCLNCHNPDKKKGGLDLSTYAGAMTGGGTGKAIEPGDPDGSLLYRLVRHEEEPNMPPKSDKLADKDLDLIKRWIAGGLLETSGSTAVASSKPKLDLTVQISGKGKPAGEPVMPGDVLLEPTIHTARTGAVLAMASSPWAPLVAVGGQKQVLLYNSKTLELLGVLPFPEGFPDVLRFSRSGKLLLVAGGIGAKSGKAVLFDVATGNRVTEVGDELDAVLAADISPDQSTIALGGPSKVVKLFSTANGAMTVKIKKHTDWVTAVAFSPDGKLLASGDRNGGLFVWESDSANEVHNLPGHKAAVTALQFRGDSSVLASSGEDGRVVLWDMASGKSVKEIRANQPGVLSLDFAPDGRLVTAGRDNMLRTWKPNGAALHSFPKFNDVALHAIFDQTDGGKRVIGADWTGVVRVFDAEQPNKPLGMLDANPPMIADRLAAAEKELANRQAACDGAALEFFKVEEDLARAEIARQVLHQSGDRVKHLSIELQRLKPRVAQAAAEFTESKHALARLQAGDFFTQVYAARQELAARKAEFDAASAAEKAARAAADKAAADVPTFEKRMTQFPQRIAAAERAIPVAERLATVAANVAKGLVAIQAEREAFLKETQARADKLADLSAADSQNKLLADAAASAKQTADLLAQELEKFKAGIKTQDRAVKDADGALAAAKANLEKERSDAKNATKILQSLRDAVAPAQAAAAEKAAATETTSKRLTEAKSKADRLDVRYAELKKQLGLSSSVSPTSTASARR